MTTTRLTNQFNLQPFKLKPILVPRIWGRQNLVPWFPATGSTDKIGEAWLTGKDNIIEGGDLEGQTMGQVAAKYPGTFGDGEFSLLVKILFPDDKLSVQVHPDDEQAAKAGLPHGKTECWYVLDAKPGAEVACGVQHGTGIEDIRAAIKDGTLESLLHFIPVKIGDMVFVDAGTIHAIGPNVTLLEVQQLSDTTYRLYDYGRERELHVEEGMEVVKPKTSAGLRESVSGNQYKRLIKEEYFIVDRFDLAPGTIIEMPNDSAGCVIGIEGECALGSIRFHRGETVILPPGSYTASSARGGSFVRAMIPEIRPTFLTL